MINNVDTPRGRALARFEMMYSNDKRWFLDNYRSIQNGSGPLKPPKAKKPAKKPSNRPTLSEVQTLFEELSPEDQVWMIGSPPPANGAAPQTWGYIYTVVSYGMDLFVAMTPENRTWVVDNYRSNQNGFGPLKPKPKPKPAKKPAEAV